MVPETVDLNKLVLSDQTAFVSAVATSSETLTVLTWVLGPHRLMPQLTFSRDDVVYLVLEGSMHVRVDRKCHQVDTGQAFSVLKQVRHQPHNNGDGPVRVAVIRTPGPVKLENFGLVRLECPICAAQLPLQKGDRADDRFVCSECDFVMTLKEHEGHLRPAPFEPELSEP